MRETVRSLRAYLFLSGGLSMAMHAATIGAGDRPFPVVALSVLGLLAAAGLFYMAVRLPRLLRDDLERALAIIYFNMFALSVILVVVAMAGASGIALGQVVLGLLILWYIRANLKRLSAEQVAEATAAA